MAFPKTGGGYQYDDGNTNEPVIYSLPDPITKTAAATLTPQEFTSGIVVTSFGSAQALTTPTGADLDAYMVNAKVGTTFWFTICGTAAFANTLTGGTGVTVVGAAATTASALGSSTWQVRKTGTGTWSAYRS